MADLTNSALGGVLRTLREANSLTTEEAARRAKIHPATYQEIEQGEFEATWGELRRIADALGIKLPEFLRLAEKKVDEGVD